MVGPSAGELELAHVDPRLVAVFKDPEIKCVLFMLRIKIEAKSFLTFRNIFYEVVNLPVMYPGRGSVLSPSPHTSPVPTIVVLPTPSTTTSQAGSCEPTLTK